MLLRCQSVSPVSCMVLSLVAVLKRVILKIGRADSLLLNFLVPGGGLFMTVPKWFSCLSFVGLACAVVLPVHLIASAAARRNTCSWSHGVSSSDAYETTWETKFG